MPCPWSPGCGEDSMKFLRKTEKEKTFLSPPSCLPPSHSTSFPFHFQLVTSIDYWGENLASYLGFVYLMITTTHLALALLCSTPQPTPAFCGSLLFPSPCSCATARTKAPFSSQPISVVSKGSSTTEISGTAILFSKSCQ